MTQHNLRQANKHNSHSPDNKHNDLRPRDTHINLRPTQSTITHSRHACTRRQTTKQATTTERSPSRAPECGLPLVERLRYLRSASLVLHERRRRFRSRRLTPLPFELHLIIHLVLRLGKARAGGDGGGRPRGGFNPFPSPNKNILI